MDPMGTILESYALTGWLCLVIVAYVRRLVAAVFFGSTHEYQPMNLDHVDRSPDGLAANAVVYQERRAWLLLAMLFGWAPGLLVSFLLGPGSPVIDGGIFTGTIATAVIYLRQSIRRFDREGEERLRHRLSTEKSDPTH